MSPHQTLHNYSNKLKRNGKISIKSSVTHNYIFMDNHSLFILVKRWMFDIHIFVCYLKRQIMLAAMAELFFKNYLHFQLTKIFCYNKFLQISTIIYSKYLIISNTLVLFYFNKLYMDLDIHDDAL